MVGTASDIVDASQAAFGLGESPVWDERRARLLFVDIHVGEVHQLEASGVSMIVRLPERVGAVGLTDRDDALVLGLESGFALLTPSGMQRWGTVESDKPSTRLNDGRVDRQGRFVCGGMDESEPQRPDTAVYRLDRDGTHHEILLDVHCANATCFSPDGGTMYFSDMASGEILAYAYDAEHGVPHSPRVLVAEGLVPGAPDGATVDADGFVWNARWGAGLIVRIAPDGRIDRQIEVPVTNPTSLAFGGELLDELYVTSARFGLSPQQLDAEALAGHVLKVDAGVRGIREPRFLL